MVFRARKLFSFQLCSTHKIQTGCKVVPTFWFLLSSAFCGVELHSLSNMPANHSVCELWLGTIVVD